MLQQIQELLIRRAGSIQLTQLPSAYLVLEAAYNGYSIPGEVQETTTNESLAVIEAIKAVKGASYDPLFVNFPKQPALYNLKRWMSIFFYDSIGEPYIILSCGHRVPTDLFDMNEYGGCPLCQRALKDWEKPSKNPVKRVAFPLTPLKIVEDVPGEVIEGILGLGGTWNEQDKIDIQELKDYHLSDSLVKNEENLVYLQCLKMARGGLFPTFKNMTHLMRFAAELSQSDTSLRKPRFKIRRRYRKEFSTQFERLAENPESEQDVAQRAGQWVRLLHALHIGELHLSDKAQSLIHIIRNGHPKSFNAIVGAAGDNALEILASRPGLFGRRLREMANVHGEAVLPKLRITAKKMTTRMLLDLESYFLAFYIYGTFERYAISNDNPPKIMELPVAKMDGNLALRISEVLSAEIERRLSSKPAADFVFTDSLEASYLLPVSTKTASLGDGVPRGSTIPVGDAKILRMFIYWKDGDDRCDVDLSGVLYDETWRQSEHIAFTRLKAGWATHSGDIQGAPNGAAEYIDIDIEAARKRGRYVVLNAILYRGNSFKQMEVCNAGYMIRDGSRGEIFEPATVKTNIKINTESSMTTILILDLDNMAFTWADMPDNSSVLYRAVASGNDRYSLAARALMSMAFYRPSANELILRYATAAQDSGAPQVKIGVGGDIDPRRPSTYSFLLD